MTFQKTPDSETVTQALPEKRQMSLEGLYFGQRLAEISRKIRRTLVITNFLMDRNGVIAKADAQHNYHVPVELKNHSDWRLFQELMAQADVIISGGAYLRRVSARESGVEDILFQFEPGSRFEKLGEWRLHAGYTTRSPDLAIVSRHLNFEVPEELMRSNRRIIIFTPDTIANSDKARALTTSGILVVGSGEGEVDGNRMIEWLSNELGYRVIMMVAGPSVLELLLKANRLDIIYVTEVQREIPFDDPSTVQTILPGGKKVNELKEFRVVHQFIQEDAIAEDGSHISQVFLRYDRKSMLAGR